MSAERSDEAIYEEYRRGGEARALDALVARHWERVFRLALGVTGDRTAAEDVAQDAFVEVVVAARAGESLDPFGGWLATVVLNKARNARRGERRRVRHETAARRPEVITVESGALDEYVAKLPADLAAPLLLHYGLGLSHAETARSLGCPAGTVATRIRAALTRLREGVGAGLAVPAVLAESWEPARTARVPRAPSAAKLGAIPLRAPMLPRGAAAGLAAFLVLAAAASAHVVLGGDAPRGSAPSLHGAESAPRVALASSASNASSSRIHTLLAPPLPESSGDSRADAERARTGQGALVLAAVGPETVGEPEGRAPPYPWREYSADERARIAENERLLDERKLDVSFDDTPFDEALAFLNDVGERVSLPRVTMDGLVRELCDDEQVKVKLMVKGMTARNTLNIVVAVKDDLTYEIDPDGVRVILPKRGPDAELDRWARWTQLKTPPSKRPPPPEPTAEEKRRREEARRRYENVLAAKVDYDFQSVTLGEAVESFSEKTDVPFTISKSIDSEAVKISGSGRGVPVREALEQLLEDSGFTFQLRNETVQIMPHDEVSTPRELKGIWKKPVTLALRGVPLREVLRALEPLGVRSLVSPEGWRSNGTISLVVADMPLLDVLQLVKKELPLACTVVDEEPDDDGGTKILRLVMRGEIASAREALSVAVPSFAGVAKQVEALRVQLRAALRARHAARGSTASGAELLAKERAVHELAASVLDVVRRAEVVAGARERKAALSSARLEGLKAELAAARRTVEVAGAEASVKDRSIALGLEGCVLDLEHDLEAAAKDVALLEKLDAGEPLPGR